MSSTSLHVKLQSVCFTVSSMVNLILFIALIPVVIYASLRPLFCHGYAHFLEAYQSLPTVGVLPTPAGQWDDLSLYLLFLEENISELKSYKYIKVCEHGLCVFLAVCMSVSEITPYLIYSQLYLLSNISLIN